MDVVGMRDDLTAVSGNRRTTVDTGGPLRRPLPYSQPKDGVEIMKGQSWVLAGEPPGHPTGLELGEQGKGPERVVTSFRKAAMGPIWGVEVIGSLSCANIARDTC